MWPSKGAKANANLLTHRGSTFVGLFGTILKPVTSQTPEFTGKIKTHALLNLAGSALGS